MDVIQKLAKMESNVKRYQAVNFKLKLEIFIMLLHTVNEEL